MATSDLTTRILARDNTLWQVAETRRAPLEWIDLVSKNYEYLLDMTRWAESIDQSKILVLGMGTSSLAPRLFFDFMKSHGPRPQREIVSLDCLDSRTFADIDLTDTAVVVSSKSGVTLETDALFRFFYSRLGRPERFIAITEPGSPLDIEANELGFKRVFHCPAAIGDRFSAFSELGIVPAALAGMDLFELFDQATKTDLGTYVQLGEVIGDNANANINAIEILHGTQDRAIALWSEQLLAMTSADTSKCLIPVPSELSAGTYPRSKVPIAPKSIADLAQLLYGLQFSAAAAGYALEINPFLEYDDRSARDDLIESLRGTGPRLSLAEVDFGNLGRFLDSTLYPGDPVAISAYQPLAYENQLVAAATRLAGELESNMVTAGLAPRHLHSTAQLHRDGPAGTHVVQVISKNHGPKILIPSMETDFNSVIAAQADREASALAERGHNVSRIYS